MSLYLCPRWRNKSDLFLFILFNTHYTIKLHELFVVTAKTRAHDMRGTRATLVTRCTCTTSRMVAHAPLEAAHEPQEAHTAHASHAAQEAHDDRRAA